MSVTFSVCERRPFVWDGEVRQAWCPADGAPEGLNLANGNAKLILDALGIDSAEPAGEIEASDLLARIGRARVALSRQPSEFERQERTSGGDGRCRMIAPGYTAEQILDRLARLEVLALACGDGQVVGWA